MIQDMITFNLTQVISMLRTLFFFKNLKNVSKEMNNLLYKFIPEEVKINVRVTSLL